MIMDYRVDPLILLGDPLQEPSEIQFLAKLREDLKKHRCTTPLIFGNFFAGTGRKRQQIDFLVVAANCACVVELKSYKPRVFGKVNGPWELRDLNGNLIESLGVRNPYHQAREAKYTISNEMLDLSRTEPKLPIPSGKRQFYSVIESVVCIFPDIPHGSMVTPGDFKAHVMGYPAFLKFLCSCTTNPQWTEADWLKLAAKLNLRREESFNAIQSVRSSAIERSNAYLHRFWDYYGRNLPKLVPTSMTADGNACSIESLSTFLATACNLQVIGPSGSGKSHLIKHFAISSISDGYAPVFLPAKYFRAKFSDLLERGVAHLHPGKSTELLNDFAVAGKRPYLLKSDTLCQLDRVGTAR